MSRKSFIKSALTLGGTLLSLGGFAQVQIGSLDDLIALADKHNLTIQNAAIQNEIAQSQVKEAKSYRYPTITGFASANDNLTIQKTLVPERLINPSASENSFTEMQFGRQYLYSAGVQAQWDILDFQRKFAADVQKEQAFAQKRQEKLIRFNTYNTLAEMFYSVLLVQEVEKICSENVDATEQLLDNAQKKYLKGLISEADKGRIEASHLRNERNLNKTEQDKTILLSQLQQQLGVDQEIVITDSVGKTGLKKQLLLDSDLWGLHPQIAYQENQTKVAKKEVTLSKAVRLPKLGFVYNYNYNWATDDFMSFSNVNSLPQQYVGVKLSMPIFSGFSTQEKIKQATLKSNISKNNLLNAQWNGKIQDDILIKQYHQSDLLFRKSQDILAVEISNDGHYQNQYDAGIISLDTRLNEYEQLLQAQNDYLQSLANLKLATYKIYLRQLNY